MSKPNETKTLIVTETVSYEFEVPASMAEDGDSLKRFFGKQPDPPRRDRPPQMDCVSRSHP